MVQCVFWQTDGVANGVANDVANGVANGVADGVAMELAFQITEIFLEIVRPQTTRAETPCRSSH